MFCSLYKNSIVKTHTDNFAGGIRINIPNPYRQLKNDPGRFMLSSRLMNDEYYMRIALREAEKAMQQGEVPVGAVVVLGEQIIARGSNMVEKLKDPTAHAEMIALTSAFNHLGTKYLPEATIYITVEPCLMCAGAMYWSKITRIVWGADDEKNGFARVAGSNSPFHPKAIIQKGLLADDCGELMRSFFRSRR